jgi:hypothetical protein
MVVCGVFCFGPAAAPECVILVSTAHFPWCGNPIEVATGQNQRIQAAKRTVSHLKRLLPADPGSAMPAFFMGQ